MINPIKYNINNLFFAIPDTELIKIIENANCLLYFCPEILDRIFKDQEDYCLLKKQLRLDDKKFYFDKTSDISDFILCNNENDTLENNEISLMVGRTRMKPQVLYLFMVIRGYLGSVTDKEAIRTMMDSITISIILENWSVGMPGPTTILENLNCISNETKEFILEKQISYIISQELDDFSNIMIDSTSVKANTCWPTDSKILFSLLNQAYHYSQKLHIFGISNFNPFWMEAWLKEINQLNYKIVLTGGKVNSKKQVKKFYRKLLKKAQKSLDYMICEIDRLNNDVLTAFLPPSIKKRLLGCWNIINSNIQDVAKVLYYTEQRVFNEIVLPSTQKILSVSDKTAAFIKKGDRNPLIGYKPQVSRSSNGFIPSIKLPLGNASDSKEFIPTIEKIIKCTGVIPHSLNVDDGYASNEGMMKAKSLGIKVVSISGSKGKKLTTLEDWNSDEYKQLRSDRSAVESIMFTLKYSYNFGTVLRRGIENVYAELLEKVIVYNFARITYLIESKRKKYKKTA